MMTLLEKLTQALDCNKVPVMIELASTEPGTRIWALVQPRKVARRKPAPGAYAISIFPVVDEKIGLNRKSLSTKQPETLEELVEILTGLGAKVETATEFSKDSSSRKENPSISEDQPLTAPVIALSPLIAKG